MINARIFIVGLLSLVLVQPLFGQFGARARQNVKQVVERQVKPQKRLLTQQMDSRVDEVVRICELEPRQKKKLQIAAKGAVAKSLEYYAKYMESVYARQFNRKVRGRLVEVEERLGIAKAVEAKKAAKDREAAKKAAKNKAKVKKKAKKRNKRKKVADPAQVVRRLLRALPYKRPIPWEEKIWLKALSKTLNEKQNAAFDKHVKLRRAFNRRAGISTFISQIDRQLFLSADQRESLKKIVDEVYGKQLETAALNQIYATRGWAGLAANGRRRTKLMPQAKLKKVLSKSQLAIWNGQLRNAGAFGRMGLFGAFGGGALGLPQVIEAIAAPIVQPRRVKKAKPTKKAAAKKKKVIVDKKK